MKRAVSLVNVMSFSLVVLFSKPAFADPVEWVDRCVAEFDRQMKNELTQLTVNQGLCAQTIVRYCAFSRESASCYNTLIEEFAGRAKANVAEAPANIQGNSVRQRMYQDMLKLSHGNSTLVPCDAKLGKLHCAAKRALQSYIFSRSIQDWITKFEEPK
jgi:hypothetical protein